MYLIYDDFSFFKYGISVYLFSIGIYMYNKVKTHFERSFTV